MKILISVIMLFISNSVLATSYTLFPNSINELVDSSDLIIMGTFGEVVDERPFYGYPEDVKESEEKDLTPSVSLALPLVDFSIKVQEIIMDDSSFPVANRENGVIFRTFQYHDEIFSAMAMEERAGTLLFFLTRTPDNEAYGITSLMHKLKLGDDIISYSMEGTDYPLPFAEGMTVTDFIQIVKQHVQTKYQPKNITGIWQDLDNKDNYYSLHHNDHTVIMIDLSHVAHSGQTLSATYVGSSSTVSESYILKPMLSGLSVNLTVLSSEDAIIAPICDTCSVISTQLKKIF